MRVSLGASLFGLAVLAVACGGGGGGSNVLPGPGGGGSTGTPSNAKTTKAEIIFKIPPGNRQASRKPFYISSNTQSFGILAVPFTSTETPTPENVTVFPVAAPACSTVSGGGTTCTFNVVAPIGQDNFFIGAFPTATLNANSIPLSEFIGGPITVSASPGPEATPLSFSLDGVVNSVAITVASPDPGNTPNTQVFTAASPSAAEPLGITAYDSGGNVIAAQASIVFGNPITITVSPASAGIGLALNSQCPTQSDTISRPRRRAQFGTGQPSVVITCAADLNNVTYGYDGTPHPDASDHLVDTFTVNSSIVASPAPSPANVVLASNLLTWEIEPGAPEGGYWESGYLIPMSNGQLLYLGSEYVYAGSTYYTYAGTLDPTTNTLSAPAILNGVPDVDNGAAISTNGNLWVNDYTTNSYTCYSSVASALAGNAPVATAVVPEGPASDSNHVLQPTGLSADGAGNIWFAGYDTSSGQTYAGYFSSASNCVAGPPDPIAQFTLTNDLNDYTPSFTLSGSVISVQSSGTEPAGVYSMTTSTTPGNVSPVNMNLAVGRGAGLGVDANGTLYGATADFGSVGNIETLASGGSSFTTLLSMPPIPEGSFPYPYPRSVAAFSPNGMGAADRAMYDDQDYASLALISDLSTAPNVALVNLPNAYSPFQPVYSTQGSAYVTYFDQTNNWDLAEVLPTTTWSVPNLQATALECSSNALLSIVEFGDSGPFTVSISPTTVIPTPLPGADHDFFVSIPGVTTTFTAQVTDNHGRTEAYAGTSNPASDEECGIARRPLHHHQHPPN